VFVRGGIKWSSTIEFQHKWECKRGTCYLPQGMHLLWPILPTTWPPRPIVNSKWWSDEITYVFCVASP
jgi:hypothetical protein